jgi:hypothetical protein
LALSLVGQFNLVEQPPLRRHQFSVRLRKFSGDIRRVLAPQRLPEEQTRQDAGDTEGRPPLRGASVPLPALGPSERGAGGPFAERRGFYVRR